VRFWWRRGGDRPAQDKLGGEPALRGPEGVYYQFRHGHFTKVSSNGSLTLTPTRLIFDSKIGRDVTVPMTEITDIRDEKVQRVHINGHDTQLIIATAAGEIGFILDDSSGWASAVRAQLGP
jgi:hypothetical protein